MPSLLVLESLNGYRVKAVPYAYEEAGRQQFRAVPGCRWQADPSSPNGRGYYVGAREAIEIVARTLEAAGVCKVRRELGELHPGEYNLRYSARLRDYQIEGIRWLQEMLLHEGAALLADDMGLGKSVQALTALRSVGVTRLLIVCPAGVTRKWLNKELRTWWPEAAEHALITSFDKLGKLVKELRELPLEELPNGVIVDEIHKWQTPGERTPGYAGKIAARSRYGLELFKLLPRTVPVVALSGTPMNVRPRDLWNPLNMLWPDRFGDAIGYQKRYCAGHSEEIENVGRVWVSDGASWQAELGERMRAVMLRREKHEVSDQLPPLTREVREVAIPSKAKRTLVQAAALIDWQPGSASTVHNSLRGVLREAESYKIEAAIELAIETLEEGGRPLLLTTRKVTAQQLGEQLDCPWVTGDETGDREAILQAGDGAAVATMYSVQEGIDLVAFDVVIFVGLDWSPTVILQAEARAHRIGQNRNVQVYYLIGVGTLDEVVRDRVIERLDAFATIVGSSGHAAAAADLRGGSDEDLIASIIADVQAMQPRKKGKGK